jgi:tetratricopeptide (TPR) repeat protein
MKLIFFLFFLILCTFYTTFAQSSQQKRTDSLRTVAITYQNPDTVRTLILNNLSLMYMNFKPDSALLLAQQASQLAQNLRYNKGIAQSLTYMGIYYNNKDNYDIAINYQLKALEINELMNNSKGMADNFLSIGFVYQKLRENEKASEYYEKALPLYTKLNDKTNIARLTNNLGIIYKRLTLYEKALEAYQQSLKIKEEVGDKRGSASTLSNIGEVLELQKKYEEALTYCYKSLKVSEESNNQQVVAIARYSLASIHQKLNQLDKSVEYATKALSTAQKNGFKADARDAASILSETYILQKDYEKALEYYQYAARVKDSIFDIDKTKAISTLQSTYDLEKKQKEVALLSKDKEIQKIETTRKQQMISLLEQENKIRKSEAAQQLLNIMLLEKEKKLKEDEIDRQQTKLALQQSETEKQKALLKLQEEELEIQNIRQKAFYVGFVLILLVFFVLAYSYYQRAKANALLTKQKNQLAEKNEEINQQKEELEVQAENLLNLNTDLSKTLNLSETQKLEIEKKNQNITASIQYAKKIQNAMLPFPLKMDESFGKGNHFVLFKPKDIVSGDFYWLQDTKVNSYNLGIEQTANNERKIMVAVADCTGHGVPGAFMSMIGNELLNQIINISHVEMPDQVLEQLHTGVRYALNQEQQENNDGMDIALLTIDYQNKKAYYAGAMNSLYYVQHDKFHEIKADKIPIGGLQHGKNRKFNLHTITLQEEQKSISTIFYLCSDGFQDQFGGENGKKFMAIQLKNLLFANHEKDFATQKSILDDTIENWKSIGREQQIDDITVMGLRITV